MFDAGSLLQKVINLGDFAPWFLFFLILLAGANFPISIDILLVLSAFISATVFPEKVYLFFATFTAGCIISAWVAYWIGRKVGRRIFKIRFFAKLLPEKRVNKIADFYKKYGFWTFLVGRFIPFGIRNCLFMSSGMARMSFAKFVIFDFIACSLWSSLFFFCIFRLGKDYDTLLSHLKTINIYLFLAFGVSIISLICYKMYKRNKSTE